MGQHVDLIIMDEFGYMGDVKMSFEEEIKKAGFKLAELKEAFIIEEIRPFIEDESLKQSLRVRLKSNHDAVNEYKQKIREAYTLLKESLGKDFFDITRSPYARAMIEFEKGLGLE